MRMLEMFKDIKGGSEIIRKDNDYKIPDRFWKQQQKKKLLKIKNVIIEMKSIRHTSKENLWTGR